MSPRQLPPAPARRAPAALLGPVLPIAALAPTVSSNADYIPDIFLSARDTAVGTSAPW